MEKIEAKFFDEKLLRPTGARVKLTGQLRRSPIVLAACNRSPNDSSLRWSTCWLRKTRWQSERPRLRREGEKKLLRMKCLIKSSHVTKLVESQKWSGQQDGRKGQRKFHTACALPECSGGDIMHQLSKRQWIGWRPTATAHRLHRGEKERLRGGQQYKPVWATAKDLLSSRHVIRNVYPPTKLSFSCKKRQ